MAAGTTDTSNSQTGESGSHHIEIKNPDAFQSGVAGGFNWVEDNSKLVVALIVVAILGGIGYVGFQFVAKRQEMQAQDAFYAAEAPFTKKREAFERSKYRAFMPADQLPPETEKDVAATGDLAKDYGTTLEALEKVAKDFPGTSAGAQAALLAGETYLSYKQPDKTVELGQLAATKLSSGHTLADLGRMMWGNALATKGDCTGAVGVWQPLLDQNKAAYLQSDVALRSGLCFEQMGQLDRAKELYQKATAAQPESGAATTAKGLLRAIELKSPTASAAPTAEAAAAPAAAAPAAPTSGH